MGEQVFQDGLDNLLFLRPQWSGEETARDEVKAVLDGRGVLQRELREMPG